MVNFKHKKLSLILFLILTPFVFDSQKAFAGAGQNVAAAPPAPIVSAPTQRAVTANGDTVAIREIVKEKDPNFDYQEQHSSLLNHKLDNESLLAGIGLVLFILFFVSILTSFLR